MKYRVISDQMNPRRTKVYNVETGERVGLVKKIEAVWELVDGVSSCRMKLSIADPVDQALVVHSDWLTGKPVDSFSDYIFTNED